jgi:phage shock protein E
MKIALILAVVIAAVALTVFMGSAKKSGLSETQVAEPGASNESQEAKAWRLIEEGALVVDVRTPEEFAGGHLDNAVLIPHDQVPSRLAEFGDDKQAQIVLYCRSGARAGKAEAALREAGYKNVFNGGGYEPLMQSKLAP